MDTVDVLRLIHPAIAVVYVLPLVGITAFYAWQTRQRRIKAEAKEKSKIPPTVGQEHVNLGKWLAASVVGVSLLGFAHPVFKTILNTQLWSTEPLQFGFIIAMFVLTTAVLVCLYRSRTPLWRGVFATLTGMGLVLIGCQDGVYRRTNEWFISHYYYGLIAALLMVFSLAILPDIYKSKTWRRTHAWLNLIAMLFFIGQGITGTRDLLEIPLSWQEPYIYQCNFVDKTCP